MKRVVLFAALLGASPARAIGFGFGFDRVDVVSEDPGHWLNYDLPTVSSYPLRPAFRFIEQIKLVLTTPADDLYVGMSLASQSAVLERGVPGVPGLHWTVGLQTRAFLPRGIFGGLAYRTGRLRFGLGISAASAAAWSNLSWASWALLPTIGVGIGRVHPRPEQAPAPD